MPSSPVPESIDRPTSRAAKRAAILNAAQSVFFENGYVGASMDQVAERAAVSKQTVYKHFTNKQALFSEVVAQVVRARDAGITADLLMMGDGSFQERLSTFARFFLRGVMQPDVLRLRRLVIGESGRFPELGKMFYDLGPKRATEQLAQALREVSLQEGVLIEDPNTAAEFLLCLLLSIPLDRAMLLGDNHGYSEAELDHYADHGVRVFLRAFT